MMKGRFHFQWSRMRAALPADRGIVKGIGLIAIAAVASLFAVLAIDPASGHNPASFNGQLFNSPALALTALDDAGNAQTGGHLHYESGADGRNRVKLTVKHWCHSTGYFNQYLCPMPGLRFRAHHAPITFYVFDGASGRASSDEVTGAKGYRPANGGGWSECTGSGICVISASEHYGAEGTKSSWNTVSMTFQISFSVPSGTTGQIRVAAKHRHPHASSDTWAELGYAAAEPDLAVELTPYSGGSLETGDLSANTRTYAAGGTANKVRIRIMASATEPLRAAHFDHFTSVRIGIFAGASGRAASDAVSGAAVKSADGSSAWRGCQAATSAQWPCTMTSALYAAAPGSGTAADAERGVDFSFTLPAGTTGSVRLFAQFTHASRAGSGSAELAYDARPPAPVQPTSPVVQQPPPPPPPPKVKLEPYTPAGALETGYISANDRDYVAGTGRQRVRLSVVDSEGAAVAYSKIDSIKITVFSGASGRADSQFIGSSAAYAVAGGSWGACTGSGDHDICVISRAGYKLAAGASSDDADIGAIEFAFSVPAGTTGRIRLAAALALADANAAIQWTELVYKQPASRPPPADPQPQEQSQPQPQPNTPSPTPAATLTPYTSDGTLETGNVATNTRVYAKGASALNKVRLSIGPASGSGTIAYADIAKVEVYVFGSGSGRAASDALSGAAVRSATGTAWSTCAALSTGHGICAISRADWQHAAGTDVGAVAALDFGFRVPAATSGGIRLAVALYPASGSTSWTEVAYNAPPSTPETPDPVTPTPTPTATPAPKLTPYTSGGTLEASGTTSRAYTTGSTRNKVRLSVGPASGNGTISYADIDKAAIYLFSAGSGRAIRDVLTTSSVWAFNGRSWSSTCALPQSGFASCEISRAAWKTAAGASADSATVAALDFSFKLTTATSGGVRLAVALYAGGSSTPTWVEVAYNAPGTEVPAPGPPAPAESSPTPAAKLTPYTAGGSLETGDVQTNSRQYATGSTLNKVRLSVGPASGSGEISYAGIDKVAVHVFGTGSGRASSDAISGATVRASDGTAWSTCSAPSTGHAICEISRAAWKTAAGASADSATVAALDFSFQLTAVTTASSVRLAVALYAGGSSTPTWTEVAYAAPPAQTEVLAREQVAPAESSPTPVAKLTPYTASGSLETGDVQTNSRMYATGSTLNKVRLSVGPASGSGEISYADIDKVAVHVFRLGSGRASSDAISGATVRASDGTAWSTCSAPSNGHAICEISRAAWKTAAGASADSATVAALDFSFKLTATTSVSGVRLAVALYAGGGSTPTWTEIMYSQPPVVLPPPVPPAEARRSILTSPSTNPSAKLTPYAGDGTLETGDLSTNSRSYAKGPTSVNKVRLSVKPVSGSAAIPYSDIDKAAVHVFTSGNGRDAADAFSGAQVRSATGAAWSACSAPSTGHAICEISRAAWKTAAGDSSDSDSVAALDFAFRLPAGATGEARLAVMLTAKGNAVVSWAELRYSEPASTGDPVNPGDPQDQDPEDPQTPEDPQDPGDPQAPDDPQDPGDPQGPEDPQNPENPQGSEDPQGSGEPQDSEDSDGECPTPPCDGTDESGGSGGPETAGGRAGGDPWIRFDDRIPYIHRWAMGSGGDRAELRLRAFDGDGSSRPLPAIQRAWIEDPAGRRVEGGRIGLREECADGAARYDCDCIVTVLAERAQPLDAGLYRVVVVTGIGRAAGGFHVIGDAHQIEIVSADASGLIAGERFQFVVRVLDRYGNPVPDGTPVWWHSRTRRPPNDALTAALIAITPFLDEYTPTEDGFASAEVEVLGDEVGILYAYAGGTRENPDAATLTAVDTGIPPDCRGGFLVRNLQAAHDAQAGFFSSWIGPDGCRASQMRDVLDGGVRVIQLWNGHEWVRYGEVDGGPAAGASDFTVRSGDLLWLTTAGAG